MHPQLMYDVADLGGANSSRSRPSAAATCDGRRPVSRHAPGRPACHAAPHDAAGPLGVLQPIGHHPPKALTPRHRSRAFVLSGSTPTQPAPRPVARRTAAAPVTA
ncbi:hypothetical protein NKG05_02195 [Oerskovia sp. M15]